MFADDTKLYNCPLVNTGHLQDDLNKIFEWYGEWFLPLNIDESCDLHIGRGNPRTRYFIDQQTLASVSHHCDRVVTATDNLIWSTHIFIAVSRQFTYRLSETSTGCDIATSRTIYTTYVRPILEYAGPVWWANLKGDQELLESVQRWNTRLPFGRNRLNLEDGYSAALSGGKAAVV